MKKWLAFLGTLTLFKDKGNPLKDGYRPFVDAACNRLYNLMFCDKVETFREEAGATLEGVWTTLLAKQPYLAGLKSIAEDRSQESRLRLLAFNRLRDLRQQTTRQELLGVVIEIGTDNGLEVLAAYDDGRIAYVDYTEQPSPLAPAGALIAKVRQLLAVSRAAVERIGPWMQPRIAPPTLGMIRMSFLVSDGLYFGQGLINVMENDELAAPIVAASRELLQAVAGMKSATAKKTM